MLNIIICLFIMTFSISDTNTKNSNRIIFADSEKNVKEPNNIIRFYFRESGKIFNKFVLKKISDLNLNVIPNLRLEIIDLDKEPCPEKKELLIECLSDDVLLEKFEINPATTLRHDKFQQLFKDIFEKSRENKINNLNVAENKVETRSIEFTNAFLNNSLRRD